MNDFVGPILHSSLYRNPAPFAGKRVLVVGYGNSGGEIALDLSEAGVDVALSVRSPVNIVPARALRPADPRVPDASDGCRRARPTASTRRRSVWPSARSQSPA